MTPLPLKQLCERANQGLYGYGLLCRRIRPQASGKRGGGRK